MHQLQSGPAMRFHVCRFDEFAKLAFADDEVFAGGVQSHEVAHNPNLLLMALAMAEIYLRRIPFESDQGIATTGGSSSVAVTLTAGAHLLVRIKSCFAVMGLGLVIKSFRVTC